MPFKVGNPGGPGRPHLPFEHKVTLARINELRGVASEHLQLAIEEYRRKPIEDLAALSKDYSLPAYRMIIARAFITEAKDPSFKCLQEMRNLIAGPELKLEVTGPGGEPLNTLSGKTPEELVAAWREIQNQIKERECKSMPGPQPLLLPTD